MSYICNEVHRSVLKERNSNTNVTSNHFQFVLHFTTHLKFVRNNREEYSHKIKFNFQGIIFNHKLNVIHKYF